MFEKIHHLLQLVLRFFAARNIIEGYTGFLFRYQACLAPAKTQNRFSRIAYTSAYVRPNQDHHPYRNQPRQ